MYYLNYMHAPHIFTIHISYQVLNLRYEMSWISCMRWLRFHYEITWMSSMKWLESHLWDVLNLMYEMTWISLWDYLNVKYEMTWISCRRCLESHVWIDLDLIYRMTWIPYTRPLQRDDLDLTNQTTWISWRVWDAWISSIRWLWIAWLIFTSGSTVWSANIRQLTNYWNYIQVSTTSWVICNDSCFL